VLIRRVFFLVLPLFITIIVFFAFIWWLPVDAIATANCDVPDISYATIQSAVDDPTCMHINLIAPLYTENVTIDRSVPIQGLGIMSTTVDGSDLDSVFIIRSGYIVTLTDMTVTNGLSGDPNGGPDGGPGGGILNEGSDVTIINLNITNNYAWAWDGGGIFNAITGTMFITGSTISNNDAAGGGGIANQGLMTVSNSSIYANNSEGGGGIYNRFGVLTLNNRTISSNTVSTTGGGIWNYLGEAQIFNSTISGNLSGEPGSGIDNSTQMTIKYSTILGNAPDIFNPGNEGGGIRNYSDGIIYIANSIVFSNTTVNCIGPPLTSMGYNLAGDDSCNFTDTTDFPNTDPLLAPLADNGGKTLTHALSPYSPAIDQILPNINGCALSITNDQRGVLRPLSAGCDIGAYEAEVVPLSGLLAINDSPTLLGLTTTLTATIVGGFPVSFTWDFGDGEMDTGAVVTHVYPGSGIYTATITASNHVSSLTETTVVTIPHHIYMPFITRLDSQR
jgi:hypothetical protein